MAKKSIIEIDVRADSFKKFNELFHKYSSELKASGASWESLGKASDSAVKSASGSIKDQNSGLTDAITKQNDFTKAIQNSGSAFSNIAGQSKSIASSIAGASVNIAKWAAMGGVLGLAFAGFNAVAGLSKEASANRRTAQGIGVSTGEIKAAEVGFNKYIDAQGTLSKIAESQADLSKRWVFGSIGVKQEGKTAGELLPELLPKIVEVFKSVGGTQQGAQARGLLNLLSMEDLRRLSSLKPQELPETIKSYNENRSKLNVTDENLKSLQDFSTALDKASSSLKSWSLNLAAGVLDFFSNKGRHRYKTQAEIDSAKKESSVWDNIKQALFTPVGHRSGVGYSSKESTTHFTQWGEGKSFSRERTKLGAALFDQREMKLNLLEEKYKIPKGILDSIWSNESARGTINTSRENRAGALGEFQFKAMTAKEHGVNDRLNFEQASEGAAKYIKELLDKYHGNMQNAIAAYNTGQGSLDKVLAGKKHLPSETAAYIQKANANIAANSQNIKISVSNASGSNLVVGANQIGVQPSFAGS